MEVVAAGGMGEQQRRLAHGESTIAVPLRHGDERAVEVTPHLGRYSGIAGDKARPFATRRLTRSVRMFGAVSSLVRISS
jgi:hypothetical protein